MSGALTCRWFSVADVPIGQEDDADHPEMTPEAALLAVELLEDDELCEAAVARELCLQLLGQEPDEATRLLFGWTAGVVAYLRDDLGFDPEEVEHGFRLLGGLLAEGWLRRDFGLVEH